MSEKELDDTEAFPSKKEEVQDTADYLRERESLAAAAQQVDRLNNATVAVSANEGVSTPAQRSLRSGQLLAGKYRIERVIGQGGMGVVMAVEHIELRERMALKLMLPIALDNADAVLRFLREARASVKIKGEHVARVLDVGRLETGEPYIAMEYLDGIDLARALDTDGPLPIVEAIDYVLQACEALAEAHAFGIIHRDLKPANIFLTQRPDGTPLIKVLDFGISKFIPTEEAAENVDFGMTQTRQALGTPLYMPPEQMASARAADVTSDIWSLGVILFELITGAVPFQANSILELRQRIRSEAAPEMRRYRKEVPRKLEIVVQRCLARDPANRYPNVLELALDLEEFGSEQAHNSVEHIERTLEHAKVGTPLSPGAQPSASRRTTGGAQARLRRAKYIRIIAASINGSILLGLGLLVWKLSSNRAVNDSSPMPSASVVASATPSAQAVPLSGPVPIVVMGFENTTGDSAWNGLSLAGADALKQGLRTVPDVRVTSDAPAANVGGIRVTGSVKKIGAGIQIAAHVESVDISGGMGHGEPVEIDVPADQPEKAFEALRRGVTDEVRLLARLWDRHRRAVVGTQSDIARAKLLQFYAMVGPAAQRTHVGAGMDLLEAAIAADASYVPAIVERAYLRTLGGKERLEKRLSQSIAEVDKVAQMAPTDATIAVMRCRLAQFATVVAERPTDALIAQARQACRDALQLAPSSAHVPIALAHVHDLACEDDDAVSMLEQSLDLDRAQQGSSLTHLILLTLLNGQVDVADSMSAKLVALQDEDARLGERALGRRAGVSPTTDAHFLRGAVLLRREAFNEARNEFEKVLVANMPGSTAKYREAAALRGLLRAEKAQGKRLSAEHDRRLTDLEAGFQAKAKESPDENIFVAREYEKVDPSVAVEWYERVATPPSCLDTFERVVVYHRAGRRDRVKTMLDSCKPIEAWETSCMNTVERFVRK